jgi:hypothetical protein
MLSVVDCDGEGKIPRIITNDEYRPGNKILSRENAVYVHKR